MRRVLFATVLLLSCLAQRPADAFWGCGGFGSNYYGYGLFAGGYTGINDRVPPHFALYPPVYYSGEIIRIPYGASPFAAGPFAAGPFAAGPFATSPHAFGIGRAHGASSAASSASLAHSRAANGNEASESATIENPFYRGNEPEGSLPAPKANEQPSADEQGAMILNPYYRSDSQVARRQ